MQISRRAAAVGAAVLTGLATLGAAGAAFASPSAPATHGTAQVLRLHADFVTAANNSAGHGGPGDVLAALFAIRTPSGAKAGKASTSSLPNRAYKRLRASSRYWVHLSAGSAPRRLRRIRCAVGRRPVPQVPRSGDATAGSL
jgi:hypothetical protein